jgi:tetratricopeptide (TPR) repeat protein
MSKYVCDPTYLQSLLPAGAVDESVSMYRIGLQIMEGCSTFRDDDPTLETVRTDLAELLNLLERFVIPKPSGRLIFGYFFSMRTSILQYCSVASSSDKFLPMCRHDEAYELWEANLHIKERAVGPTDPSLVPHLQNLATAYAVAGKYEKCEPLLRRSLKLTTASLGPNAPQVSVPMACLATALHHMGRQYEAEPLARQALLIREAAFGPNSAIVGKITYPKPLTQCSSN